MHDLARILLVVAACCLSAGLTAPAVVLYQVDNDGFGGGMNVSEGTETRDNWVANVFTVVAGGERINRADLRAYSGLAGADGKILIYRDPDGDGNPATGSPVRLCTQTFTDLSTGWNQIPLTTPVDLGVGDKVIVAFFIANLPGDQFPFGCDNSPYVAGSWWDRGASGGGGYNLDVLTDAVPLNSAHVADGGTWVPSSNGVNIFLIRAQGVEVPEPASLLVLLLGAAALGRRRN
jgi:hypothetical protein